MPLPAWLPALPWVAPFLALARLRRRTPSLAEVAPARGIPLSIIIPARNEAGTIATVLGSILESKYAPLEVLVVDDRSTDDTAGDALAASMGDPRVRVIRHGQNKGVGAAVITGYQAALDDGATVIVKIDGDGQMDPADLPRMIAPILEGSADYVKGNRFYNLSRLRRMPAVRRGRPRGSKWIRPAGARLSRAWLAACGPGDRVGRAGGSGSGRYVPGRRRRGSRRADPVTG